MQVECRTQASGHACINVKLRHALEQLVELKVAYLRTVARRAVGSRTIRRRCAVASLGLTALGQLLDRHDVTSPYEISDCDMPRIVPLGLAQEVQGRRPLMSKICTIAVGSMCERCRDGVVGRPPTPI